MEMSKKGGLRNHLQFHWVCLWGGDVTPGARPARLRGDGGAFKEVKRKWEEVTPHMLEDSTYESPTYLIIPTHLDFVL